MPTGVEKLGDVAGTDDHQPLFDLPEHSAGA